MELNTRYSYPNPFIMSCAMRKLENAAKYEVFVPKPVYKRLVWMKGLGNTDLLC